MTKKRFTETLSTGIVTDNITGKEYNCEMRIDEELLDLLNELDERYVDEFSLRETLQQELQRIEKENETIPNTIEIMEANIQLKEENEQLKKQLQKIEDSFEVNWTQNYDEFHKDKLYIKDNNTKLCLNGENLFIEVYIPQINEYFRFKYRVTGRSLMREFIENYNSNGDVE